MGPATEVGADQIARLKEVLGWVHDFAKTGYAAGTDHFTLADICFVATFSTLQAAALVDLEEVSWKQTLENNFPEIGYIISCSSVFYNLFHKMN